MSSDSHRSCDGGIKMKLDIWFTEASVKPGYSLKGIKNSLSPASTQKPKSEILVTVYSEVQFPVYNESIFVFLCNLTNFSQFRRPQVIRIRKRYDRFQPNFSSSDSLENEQRS